MKGFSRKILAAVLLVFSVLSCLGTNGPEPNGRKVRPKLEAKKQQARTTPRHLLQDFRPSAKERELRDSCTSGWRRHLSLVSGQSVPVMLNCYETRGGTTYIRGKIEGDDQSLLVITISGDRLRGVLLVPSLGNCAIRSDAEGIHIQLLPGESWSCGTGG